MNYIGQFGIPDWFELDDDTPKIPLTPDEEKRAKWRDYKRRERERKVAAIQAKKKEKP